MAIGFGAHFVKPRARFIEKRIGRLIAQPHAFRITPRSRRRSLKYARIMLGTETTRTTAASATKNIHHGCRPFTAEMTAAAAEPTMPIPMPIAATELAIAAPPACVDSVPFWTDSVALDCLSLMNFFTMPAMLSPIFFHGAQNASSSETWFSTTLVMTASQSLPSRS